MEEPTQKVIHGGKKPTFTRGDLKRSVPVIAGVVVLLGLIVWAGIAMYAQLNPSVEKARVPTPLDAISKEDTNYSEMTKEQIDLQLKRQTGLSISQLKDKTLSRSTFGNYDNAYRAAKALLAYGQPVKALEAYGVIAKSWPSQCNYNFYLEYAYEALAQNNNALALEQLKVAKPKIDSLRSEETKKEATISYELMRARAGGDN